MTHRLAICLAIASLTFAGPRPAAAAAIGTVFDTVDAVEINNDFANATVVVTGLRPGGSVPITVIFTFGNSESATNIDTAARCERLAVIAMSKPGKFQFAIGSNTGGSSGGGCKLILRTP